MNQQVYDTDPMKQAAKKIQDDYQHAINTQSNYHKDLTSLYKQADSIPKNTLLGGMGFELTTYINWWSAQVSAIYDDYMALARGLNAGADQAIATDTQIAHQLGVWNQGGNNNKTLPR